METPQGDVLTPPEILPLSGEWDVYRRDELKGVLNARLPAPSLVIDLSAVTYMDSSCLGTMMYIRNARVAEGRPVPAVVVTGILKRVWETVRFDLIFPSFSSLAEALAAAQRGGPPS